MKELVFLLEEESARAMFQSLLPRFLDPRIQVRLIAFEGKQDLEKQVARRIRGYVNPDARFIVMRDLDSSPDCKVVKKRLVELCRSSGRLAVSLVRIACKELETFYLADLNAVESALRIQGLSSQQASARFRIGDSVVNPSSELAKLTKGAYQKVSGSRVIGTHLEIDNARSPSFRCLVAGIRRFEQELLALP